MEKKIPSSGSAVPAGVRKAMESGLRQRFAVSAAELPKSSKTGGVKK